MEDIKNALNKPGVVIDRWILRLGKAGDEAGKFQPWFLPSNTFEQDLESFLACLNLLKLHNSVKERMSTQAKGVREVKKQQKAVQKELNKATAKAQKETERAQKKLARTAEKERIKADAKRAREEAKLSKNKEPGIAYKPVPVPLTEAIVNTLADTRLEGLPTPSWAEPPTTVYEDFPLERKPISIPKEEG